MTAPEDTEANDDEEMFVQLIADHQNVIRSFIISLLPGAPGVDDVFQNTNAVIWKKRGSFEMGTNFRAWAMTIARFQAMAHLQQLRRRRAEAGPTRPGTLRRRGSRTEPPRRMRNTSMSSFRSRTAPA